MSGDVTKRVRFELITTCSVHPDRATVLADALSAAGLLVTPLHERALEACKQMAESGVYISSKGNEEGFRVGREALEREKPKPRWRVMNTLSSEFPYAVVEDATGNNRVSAESQFRHKPDAEARADALNKLEEK